MSKIEIKVVLKTKTSIHEFFGKAIKNGNIITYNDNNVVTKIDLNKLSIERTKDYYIKLKFKENEVLEGIYQTKEGNFNVKTETKELNIKKDSIKIKYNLIINNVLIDTFLFSLQYTIDR